LAYYPKQTARSEDQPDAIAERYPIVTADDSIPHDEYRFGSTTHDQNTALPDSPTRSVIGLTPIFVTWIKVAGATIGIVVDDVVTVTEVFVAIKKKVTR
jgi:hypothetical protein